MPIALGLLINKLFGKYTEKAKDALPSVSVAAICMIVAAVVSRNNEKYTPEFKAALQDTFINIINTPEGKAIFDVYSHTGYAKAVDSDYDGARQAIDAVR